MMCLAGYGIRLGHAHGGYAEQDERTEYLLHSNSFLTKKWRDPLSHDISLSETYIIIHVSRLTGLTPEAQKTNGAAGRYSDLRPGLRTSSQ
jgi:hypothetical protein